LRWLIDNTPWRSEEIKLFGKRYLQPRLTAWFGDPGCTYRYSGLEMSLLDWNPTLLGLRRRVESLCGSSFNSVLLNYYRDGNDSMGMHSDDESELGPQPVIASLSLGATRTLQFRHKTRRELAPFKLPLASGSLLVMRGATQANWKHGVAKQPRVTGPRVNLTFRRIVQNG
jgi:alkylated DNA repair dioxygenase AlkB